MLEPELDEMFVNAIQLPRVQPVGRLSRAIRPNTKMIYLETPTNPLMNIVDIQACTAMAKKRGIMVAVDNTFASPYLQNPLDLGADIVMHSVTKYLGGHSDVIMGALVVNDEKLYQDLSFIMNSCGAVPGPQRSLVAAFDARPAGQ